jgi:hypothetical protein
MQLLNTRIMKAAAIHFHDNAFIMQFIPMVLVLLMASFPQQFSQVSHSLVGKVFAVCLVLYYTRIYYVFGLVAVIFFILYYQEFEEPFELGNNVSLVGNKLPLVEMLLGNKVPLESEKKEKSGLVEDDGTNLPPSEELEVPLAENTNEGFTEYTKDTGSISASALITIDQFNDAKDTFIKEKCKNGVLMYKMMPVRNEMADHVYSEISFNSDNKCNPCDSTCDYNIIEAKLKTQESLISKISKPWFSK